MDAVGLPDLTGLVGFPCLGIITTCRSLCSFGILPLSVVSTRSLITALGGGGGEIDGRLPSTDGYHWWRWVSLCLNLIWNPLVTGGACILCFCFTFISRMRPM